VKPPIETISTEPDRSEAGLKRSKPRISQGPELLATFFGVGRIKPGPGSWASAFTTLLWAALASVLPATSRTPAVIALASLVIAVGIPAATRVSRGSGIKDPQFVVIDEVAGQLIALVAVPLSWKFFLAAFILFRAFDILKPPPVRQLETLPEGTGIVLDDVAAGLYALLAVHLLMRVGLLR